ncbi:MAG TPA: ergothioneine biosynthesis protein EgtB [Methylotenera sp.]|nr:ergothioneine biosynthesis protein EgtB [Methylotenera sp.]
MMIDQNQKESLISTFQKVRDKTLEICRHIQNEDYSSQPIPDVSPPKWHLGHTTWFFEEVILVRFLKNYQHHNNQYSSLFNSYYKALGKHTIQPNRGSLSRPTVEEITQYRTYVDRHLLELITQNVLSSEMLFLIEAGIHHEQQHQELLYMDIKYILGVNELETAYSKASLKDAPKPRVGWSEFKEDIYEVGFDGEEFAYDNEKPRHKNYLYPFAISQTLVTNGEFLEFIEDNGYSKPQHWLSQGWDWINEQQIEQPLYWSKQGGIWHEYTLYGLIPIDLHRPLVHISYFEADAFASWKKLRLPTEHELEVYLNNSQMKKTLEEDVLLHPNDSSSPSGEVWCWTRSQYSPYPRFKAFDGLLNEYNGKFMCNQFVLKGGCIATPNNHYRHTYRNFYQPQQRWMFSGIRLAKDVI